MTIQKHRVKVVYSDKSEDKHVERGHDDFGSGRINDPVKHSMKVGRKYEQHINVKASSKHEAINKASVHITKNGYRLHSAHHVGIHEIYQIEEGIVYSDSKEPFTGDIRKINPNKAYKNHLENHHYLNFIQKNSKDPREKIQCTKEIDIAEKKMNFWKRHPEFSKSQQEKDHAEVKKKWTVKEEIKMAEDCSDQAPPTKISGKYAPKKLRDIAPKPTKTHHEYKGNTPDEQAIVARYDANTVRHPDRNGNGDDVFKASKIERDEKAVVPGDDEKKYKEWNSGAS